MPRISNVMAAAKAKAGKGKKGVKARITAKQKAARRKNIEIARRSKQKGKGDRAKENIKIGFALAGAQMNMSRHSVQIDSLKYDQKNFKKKHGRESVVLRRKINEHVKEYASNEKFYNKYKNRKTRD